MSNATETTAAASTPARRQEWPQRFGTIKSISVRQSRNGRYATVELDCKTFTQEAKGFGEDMVAKITAAGVGASVWFKGPIEPVQRKNAAGRTYTEEQMKIVYFKDNSVAPKKEEATDGAGEQAEGASEQTAAEVPAATMDDEIPF